MSRRNVPIFRFKGFTGDWDHRKLGDVVEVCSGRDYKHLDEGDIPVYGTGGYMLSVSEALSEKDDAIGIGRKGTIDSREDRMAQTLDELNSLGVKKLNLCHCSGANLPNRISTGSVIEISGER